jgi:hypothetical protein
VVEGLVILSPQHKNALGKAASVITGKTQSRGIYLVLILQHVTGKHNSFLGFNPTDLKNKCHCSFA